MRSAILAAGVAALAIAAGSGASAAPRSPQSLACSKEADGQKLHGKAREHFRASCMKGPLGTVKPTEPVEKSKESQAVTKPSGADRNVRTKQCADEADRRGLSQKDRSQFQLSCLATAGPVSEGETGTQTPHPANAIKGIGVNNYKPSATTAKSQPKP